MNTGIKILCVMGRQYIVKIVPVILHTLLIAVTTIGADWLAGLNPKKLEALGVPPEMVPVVAALLSFAMSRINSVRNKDRFERLVQKVHIEEAKQDVKDTVIKGMDQ